MHGRFNWMLNCRWTVNQICSEFSVSPVIAQHIQHIGCDYQGERNVELAYVELSKIAAAHHELCNGQLGF